MQEPIHKMKSNTTIKPENKIKDEAEPKQPSTIQCKKKSLSKKIPMMLNIAYLKHHKTLMNIYRKTKCKANM